MTTFRMEPGTVGLCSHCQEQPAKPENKEWFAFSDESIRSTAAALEELGVPAPKGTWVYLCDTCYAEYEAAKEEQYP